MKYLFILIGVIITMSSVVSAKNINDVKARLTDPVIESLYTRTYNSILERS